VTAILWAGILAGPAAWAVDLTASYALVHWTCRTRHTTLLHLVSASALVVIAAGVFAAWRGLQDARVGSGQRTTAARRVDRQRFMAVLGLVMCALFATVVIAGALPRWILDACP
jgi:hypothetical protein